MCGAPRRSAPLSTRFSSSDIGLRCDFFRGCALRTVVGAFDWRPGFPKNPKVRWHGRWLPGIPQRLSCSTTAVNLPENTAQLLSAFVSTAADTAALVLQQTLTERPKTKTIHMDGRLALPLSAIFWRREEKTALSTHSHHVTGCRSLFRPQCCHCNLPLDLQPGVGDRRSDTKSTANQGQTQSPPPGSQPRPSPRKQDTRRRQQAASKAEQNYETANPPCV